MNANSTARMTIDLKLYPAYMATLGQMMSLVIKRGLRGLVSDALCV